MKKRKESLCSFPVKLVIKNVIRKNLDNIQIFYCLTEDIANR